MIAMIAVVLSCVGLVVFLTLIAVLWAFRDWVRTAFTNYHKEDEVDYD